MLFSAWKLQLTVVTEFDLTGGQRERVWMPHDPSHWELSRGTGQIVNSIVLNVGSLSLQPYCFLCVDGWVFGT